MALKKRSGYWIADMRDLGGGRSRLGKVGEVSEARVRAEYNTMERDALEGKGVAVLRGMSVDDCYRKAMLTHWQGMKYQHEVELHWKDISQYFAVTGDVNQELTTLKVDDMRGALLARGLSPKTVNRKLAVVSKLAHLAVDWGVLKRMPKIKRMKEGSGRVRWYSDEELQSIAAWFNSHHHIYFSYATWFMVDTGWRISEVLGLRDADIDGRVAYLWDQKSGKRTATPLTQTALASARVLVGHPLRGTLTVHLFDKVWRRMALATGITGTPHACRHTCAMRLAHKGIDVVTIREFMRHADVRTTMIYLHLAGGALRGAADALESVAKTPLYLATG